jgi:hypothetical protein
VPKRSACSLRSCPLALFRSRLEHLSQSGTKHVPSWLRCRNHRASWQRFVNDCHSANVAWLTRLKIAINEPVTDTPQFCGFVAVWRDDPFRTRPKRPIP